MNSLISIIIPVYNEEENIPLLYNQLTEVWKKLGNSYDPEIIFVNDGSTDQSASAIDQLVNQDSKLKYIELSRNFGKETATTAGLNNCQGDACIMLDGDLQHPVELIPEFLTKWEDGSEIIVGLRESREKEGIAKRIGSTLFYKIIHKIAKINILSNATDLRLLDRVVIDEYNKLTEKNRMTRALIDWLGFKRDYVHFKAKQRRHGTAGYSFWKLLRLAINSFVSLSLFPLKLAGYTGIIITLLSGGLGLFIFIESYLLNDPLKLNFSGVATLAVLILFLVGIILICLGLMALYIASIHGEVLDRPLYVIRRKKL